MPDTPPPQSPLPAEKLPPLPRAGWPPPFNVLQQELKELRAVWKSFLICSALLGWAVWGVKGGLDKALIDAKQGTIEQKDAIIQRLREENAPGHPSFYGVFDIPAGQSYVDVVVSLEFKPIGALGTIMDSNCVIAATVDDSTFKNASTSGIRFNLTGAPLKKSRLAVHIF